MANVKTINGVAIANAKTIHGVVNANVKTINGVTVTHGPSAAPTAVSATAVGTVNNATDGRINLVWTNGGDTTSVTRIYNGATLLATSTAGATTYSVTGLNANTSYTLTVKHYLSGTESAGSSFSATTTFQYSGYVISHSQRAGDPRYTDDTVVANGSGGTYNNAVLWAYCTSTLYTTAGLQYYTVPSGVTQVAIVVNAGGGASVDGGGGGAGGSCIGYFLNVSTGDVLDCTVGSRGKTDGTNAVGSSVTSNSYGSLVLAARGWNGDGNNVSGGNCYGANGVHGYLNALGQSSDHNPNTNHSVTFGGGSGSSTGKGLSYISFPTGYGDGGDPSSAMDGGDAMIRIVENPTVDPYA